MPRPGHQTGVQDAVNLGWKLAQVVKGMSPESLLDTYHVERFPVAALVLRNTMASVALRRSDERTLILAERSPFYAKADLICDTSGKSLMESFLQLNTLASQV